MKKPVNAPTHPCNHTPREVREEICRHLSSVPAKVALCTGCTCAWRAPNVQPADPHGGLPSIAEKLSKLGIRSTGVIDSDFTISATGGGTQRGTNIGRT